MTRAFWILWKRETGALLLSPIGWVLLTCMALVNGFSFSQCVSYLGNGVREFTVMQIYFYLFHFWFVLIVLVPVLTMRLFSEEYKTGTIEMLLTAPVRDGDVILAKFCGVLAFYLLLWVPSLAGLGVFQAVTGNTVPVAWVPLGLSYLMVLLIGMFYLSIGLFGSVLSRNQAVSAMISFTIIALLFFAGFLSYLVPDPGWREAFNYIFILEQMRAFSMGLFDSRPVVFYLTGTAFFLLLTQRVMAGRRLKG
ncbi:MAG: ABC transporter permease [Verrucomicrobia bacterium]|nr:ABC transporter permease [Verrucomicrobiota bacterium]NBR47022.1 ABC transporter permease [Verrucomicrobiota bacterium]NBR62997.1 ABC transporter permease [Verrucomicrobiota bacterium]NDC00021.1 ABC transporter permease [Verrucomicrobiota bacterium]NDF16711.1 ABC transporter permease [Verrucomicrobiota bacterium]